VKKLLFSYSLIAGLRHFSPGFGYDIYTVFGVEGFPELFNSRFVFNISHLYRFGKCNSEAISLKCSNYSLVYWLEKWHHVGGAKRQLSYVW
jgi:hypothetical protein